MIDIAMSGHRQPRLFTKELYSRSNMIYLYNFLIKAIPNAIEEMGLSKEEVRFRNGMAGGYDITAVAVLQTLGIPYIATVPFRGQESYWPDSYLKDFYKKSLTLAEEIRCKPEWLKQGKKVAYILRDHDMVDCAQKMIGLWDGEPSGGTYETYRYAEKKFGNENCINLWPKWEEYKLNN